MSAISILVLFTAAFSAGLWFLILLQDRQINNHKKQIDALTGNAARQKEAIESLCQGIEHLNEKIEILRSDLAG